MAALLLLLASLHLAVGTASHILDDSESYHVAPYQLSKRDLEFNSYVPAYRLRGEPSCEELRTMWRLSKREARRATSTNQLPRTRPYRYGRLRAFAPSAAYGLRAHSFGAMKYDERHRHQYRMPHAGAFKKLRALIGGRRRGAFNDLRDEVGKERATNPEDTPQGQYDKLRGMLLNEKDEETSPQPLALSLRARDDGGRISTRRDPRVPLRSRYYREGFTGRLYPGDPKMSGSSEDRQLWESNHESIPYDAVSKLYPK